MSGEGGRGPLTDDELIGLIRRAAEALDPVPQHTYDEASAAFIAAHELRQGIPVALPDRIPGGAAVLDDSTALPGHQRRAPVRGRRACVETAGADRVGGPKNPSHRRNTAPARLYLAGVAAFLLLAVLARAVGVYVGDLALIFLT